MCSQAIERVTAAQVEAEIVPVEAPEGENEEAVQEAYADLMHSGYDQNDTFEELDEELRNRLAADIAKHPKFAALWRDGELVKSKDTSGSSYRFALAGWLKRLGYSAVDYGHLAYVWGFAVQKGDDREQKLTERALARDWARSGGAEPSIKERPIEIFFDPIAEAASGSNAEPIKEPRLLPTLSLVEAADSALRDPPTPLVRDLLDLGTMSVVYGPSNVGKTFVVADMAFHVAAGMRWAGHDTTKSKVLYIAAEGGHGFKKRMAALRQKYPGTADENFFVTPASVDLRTPKGDAKAVVDTIAHLGGRFGLIVVDTLSRALSGGDENGPVDMGAFVSRIDEIRHATGAHVLVVHHSGKDIVKGARGHTALRAATDTEIELLNGTLEVTKQRDLERGPGLAFTITGTVIGLDADDQPIKSATVTVGPVRRAATKPPTPSEQRALTALERCVGQLGDEIGATSSEVAQQMTPAARKCTPEAARKHLERLARKGHVIKLGAGKWTLRTESPDLSGSVRTPDIKAMKDESGQCSDKALIQKVFG